MISADAKVNIKQHEIKDLVDVSYNFFWTCIFHFDFCWYSQDRHNTFCFSHQCPHLGATKSSAAKKLKNIFFPT